MIAVKWEGIVSSVVLWVKPHLTKGGDWSQDVYTVAHKDVFQDAIQPS